MTFIKPFRLLSGYNTNMKTIVFLALLSMPLFMLHAQTQKQTNMTNELQVATLGSGCFWCTEAFFLRVKGIESVVSGYSGGKVKNPTYREVCSGLTGHAEVVQVKFNPKEISYEEVLEIFWNTHDPTTLNRQGADEGTQYRSVVFYHSEEQKKIAQDYKTQLDKSGTFKKPIVTEITPFSIFYPAEDYHQNYYALNPNQGYCQYVIRPKVEKFNKQYGSKLK
jgi:peptide-methionine (S)-S-oxide reductase